MAQAAKSLGESSWMPEAAPAQPSHTPEMELPPSPWVTYSVILALFLALFVKALTTGLRRRRRNLPPGPRPWPIIGNLNLIGALPHRSIHELSKKYGPLMHLKFGSFPVVVGSSVSMARAFLKTHDLAFAGRPKTAAGRYTAYNYSDITWSPYGPYWRQARKMCITELFSPRSLDSYEHIRSVELRGLLRRLLDAAGEPLLLKDYLTTLSLNVISRMVLGRRYLDPTPEDQAAPPSPVSPEEFKRMLDELFLLNGVLNVGDSIPWLHFLDLQGYVRRMKAVGRKFDQFMEHVLDEHIARRMKEGEDFSPRDMVDVLIQFAENPTLDVKLSRNSLKAFSQDLIAGGTESSAVTVEWAISELLRKPHIMEKAAAELDRVIGRERWVEEKDAQHLPYIEAIMKETMRLHPVAPMLVPRLAREDVVVDGYDIPAGTRILVNTFTIYRDPSIWEDPDEFRPERFLGREIDVKGHDFELLPFGTGRRMCPGYTLGLRVIQSSLANILHGFNWSLPDGMKAEELDMDEIFGLSTPKKVPLVAVAEPRLPLHISMIDPVFITNRLPKTSHDLQSLPHLLLSRSAKEHVNGVARKGKRSWSAGLVAGEEEGWVCVRKWKKSSDVQLVVGHHCIAHTGKRGKGITELLTVTGRERDDLAWRGIGGSLE